MEKYEVSAANILVADIVIFDCINDRNELKHRKLTDDERFRKVLEMNGRYFDLKTGEEYYDCTIFDDGTIYGPIFVNTGYVAKTWRTRNVSERDILRAALLWNTQLKLDELVSKRKVLLMPRERLL